MVHRNEKRKAAIWLLNELIISNSKFRATGMTDGATDNFTKWDSKIYNIYKFNDLHSKSSFKKGLLKSAVELLFNNKHIAYGNVSQVDIYDFELKATNSGEEALRDEIYEDEIEIYNNDKYFRYLRWWLPILAIVISIISLCFSTCKDSYKRIMQNESVQKQDTTTESKPK